MIKTPDVFFTGRSFQEDELKGKAVVVVDVLRASSTIITAMNNGAKGVIAVPDSGEASTIAQNLDPTGYLMCGEKDGVKIEGYHLGNSPLEYTADAIAKKTLIFNTTNGSKAVSRSASASRVFIGGFLNMSALTEKLRTLEKPLIIICAGWKNRLSFEDLLCAGNILNELYEGNLPLDAPDGAKTAFAIYGKFGHDIEGAVYGSNHAVKLRELGFEDDVVYCSRKDTTSIVPELKDGIIS